MAPPEEVPLRLTATWFKAVVHQGPQADPDTVELQLATMGLGPHFDARAVMQKESSLVKGITHDDGCILKIAVERENLPALATRLRDEYKFDVSTFGRKREDIVQYKNGSVSGCQTPYDAMMMAYNHK